MEENERKEKTERNGKNRKGREGEERKQKETKRREKGNAYLLLRLNITLQGRILYTGKQPPSRSGRLTYEEIPSLHSIISPPEPKRKIPKTIGNRTLDS
jgi:hypothetical protein